MIKHHPQHDRHTKFQLIWIKGSREIKFRKAKQVQAYSNKASKHAPTSINHKTETTHDK